jgi:hypothetical protein
VRNRRDTREEPVRITTATRPRSQDIAARQRRYLFSMSIRTVCFILAIVFRETPATWFFVVGAIFLPYVAVVIANAGASPDPGGPEAYVPEHPALESTPRRPLER